MDISVIVPIYGVENHIEKCLVSLFSQTKTEGVEFILINDCTKDNSMVVAHNVISCYPHLTVTVINKKSNGGLAAARQSGLDVARGKYIITIDSDDWVESTMLDEMYNTAIENDVDIVFSDFYFNYLNSEQKCSIDIPTTCKLIMQGLLRSEIYPSIWSKLIKKTFILKNSVSWENGLDMGEDLIIVFKLLCKHPKFVHLRKAFVHYRQNSTSMVHTLSAKSIEDMICGLNVIERILKDEDLFRTMKDDILCKKILYKAFFLSNTQGKLQESLISVYPEVKCRILDCEQLPIQQKIALYFAEHKLLKLSNFIYNVILLTKRIYSK